MVHIFPEEACAAAAAGSNLPRNVIQPDLLLVIGIDIGQHAPHIPQLRTVPGSCLREDFPPARPGQEREQHISRAGQPGRALSVRCAGKTKAQIKEGMPGLSVRIIVGNMHIAAVPAVHEREHGPARQDQIAVERRGMKLHDLKNACRRLPSARHALAAVHPVHVDKEKVACREFHCDAFDLMEHAAREDPQKLKLLMPVREGPEMHHLRQLFLPQIRRIASLVVMHCQGILMPVSAVFHLLCSDLTRI